MPFSVRRVVSGDNAQGKAVIVSDQVPLFEHFIHVSQLLVDALASGELFLEAFNELHIFKGKGYRSG